MTGPSRRQARQPHALSPRSSAAWAGCRRRSSAATRCARGRCVSCSVYKRLGWVGGSCTKICLLPKRRRMRRCGASSSSSRTQTSTSWAASTPWPPSTARLRPTWRWVWEGLRVGPQVLRQRRARAHRCPPCSLPLSYPAGGCELGGVVLPQLRPLPRPQQGLGAGGLHVCGAGLGGGRGQQAACRSATCRAAAPRPRWRLQHPREAVSPPRPYP